MFVILNSELKNGKQISISNNLAVVNNAFVLVDKPIEEEHLVIKNNKITFKGNAEFIVNNTNSNLYANMEQGEFPRNFSSKENEVELFVDNENKLNYVNDKKEKITLMQGVVEK